MGQAWVSLVSVALKKVLQATGKGLKKLKKKRTARWTELARHLRERNGGAHLPAGSGYYYGSSESCSRKVRDSAACRTSRTTPAYTCGGKEGAHALNNGRNCFGKSLQCFCKHQLNATLQASNLSTHCPGTAPANNVKAQKLALRVRTTGNRESDRVGRLAVRAWSSSARSEDTTAPPRKR